MRISWATVDRQWRTQYRLCAACSDKVRKLLWMTAGKDPA